MATKRRPSIDCAPSGPRSKSSSPSWGSSAATTRRTRWGVEIGWAGSLADGAGGNARIKAPLAGFPKCWQYRRISMKVMVLVKATADSEAGIMPSQALLTAMGQFNEELVKAGVMLAGEGLHPSIRGKRVQYSGSQRTVLDGPFAETKELVAGFWLWQGKSIHEGGEWLKRCPNPGPGESVIEIRPVFEAEDFGAELTPELREQAERRRDRIKKAVQH